MTNKLHSLLALILMAIFATGCTKQIETTHALSGTWEWKSTDGGLGFHLHQTPATTGTTQQLELKSNLQYVRYTNNAVTEEGTYSFTEQACIHDGQKKNIIHFSGSPQTYMVEKIAQQQLVLSDEHYDGVEILYERKNEAHN